MLIPSSPSDDKFIRHEEITRLKIPDWVNVSEGTFVITFTGFKSTPLSGVGVDPLKFTGAGTLVYTFDEDTSYIFANGGMIFKHKTLPKIETSDISIGVGHQLTRDVRFFRFKISDSDASAIASGYFDVFNIDEKYTIDVINSWYQFVNTNLVNKFQ